MGMSAVIIHAFAAYHKYLETADLQSVFLIPSCQLKFGKKFCFYPLVGGLKWVYDCKIDNKKGEFR